jgi:hypothetical protein
MQYLRFSARLTLTFFAIAIFGCGGGELTDQQFVGRWVEDKEDRRIEFTPNKLFSVVENGTFVKVGIWSVQGHQMSLTGLFDGVAETWKPKMSTDSFTIDLTEARFRQFDKVPATESIFDKRLVGLWRTDDQYPQIVEFTEHATLVGVFWRLDKVGGTPYPIGVQANISTAGDSKFFMDGFLGDRRMKKGVLPHPYSFEGGRLVWSAGRKNPPKVYRKVTPADIADPAFIAQFKQGLKAEPDPAATSIP